MQIFLCKIICKLTDLSEYFQNFHEKFLYDSCIQKLFYNNTITCIGQKLKPFGECLYQGKRIHI